MGILVGDGGLIVEREETPTVTGVRFNIEACRLLN